MFVVAEVVGLLSSNWISLSDSVSNNMSNSSGRSVLLLGELLLKSSRGVERNSESEFILSISIVTPGKCGIGKRN